MGYMFYDSQFNGDISKWNVSNVEDMSFMFADSPLEKNHLNGIEVKSI
jgi:surface protein